MEKLAQFRNGSVPVDRREGLSPRELLHEYDLRGRPVIVDHARPWPALHRWSFELFRTRYGHLTRTVDGRTITLAEQIDRIHTSTEEDPAPYPFNFDLRESFPELLQDLRPRLSYGRRDRAEHALVPRPLLNGTTVHELFFGGRGSFYPVLHYDLLGMATQITQIRGDKEFFLFPPEQTPLMYPRSDNPRLSQVGNAFAPDLERFPLYRYVKPHYACVREGETLFFPPGWWHATWIDGPSITYGRTVLNAGNWRRFAREKYTNWKRSSPMLALPAFAACRALGLMLSFTELL